MQKINHKLALCSQSILKTGYIWYSNMWKVKPYLSPITIRTASCIIVRASSSTESGNVALKSERVMDGWVQDATTASICSTNPISNSLSDSSMTKCSTLQQRQVQFTQSRKIKVGPTSFKTNFQNLKVIVQNLGTCWIVRLHISKGILITKWWPLMTNTACRHSQDLRGYVPAKVNFWLL